MIVIVTSIIVILGWTEIFKQTFTTTEGFRYKYHFARTLISSMDVKPFNCSYCSIFLGGINIFYRITRYFLYGYLFILRIKKRLNEL
jgi:hypothetical protein